MLYTSGGESVEHVVANILPAGFVGSRDNETKRRDTSELLRSCNNSWLVLLPYVDHRSRRISVQLYNV